MKLSETKKKILQMVVDDYIATAQPVSSKSIAEKYNKDISSATVRSELAGLEELGFLTQLHTSSGRVPSIEAYKLYVTELMDKSNLSLEDVGAIRETFKSHADNLEAVVQNTVKVISDLTDYTSIAYTSNSADDEIVKIDIFRYKKTQALLLIVTENTFIRDRFIDIPLDMTDEQIAEASVLIGKLCVGKKLGEIISIGQAFESELSTYRDIFNKVMWVIEDCIKDNKSKILLEGENKILNNPEYSDAEKVKNFLSVVTSKNKLASLLEDDSDNIEINIKIGGEEKDMPEDCSLVTATYSASGVKIGTYGVIGPLRMDYQKVVSVLEGVGKILEDLITNKK